MNKIPHILTFVLFFTYSIFCWGDNINIIRPCADTVFIEMSSADYPITKANLPMYNTSVKVGNIDAEAKFYVSLDYPEFVPLKQNEIKLLKNHKVLLSETINVNTQLTYSRKEGYLDISFCPFIKQGDIYKRLISCKLNIKSNRDITRVLNNSTTYATDKRWKKESVLAKGKWAKIRVKKEGIYTLTPAFLSRMGFNDPSKVKLFGYGGRIIEENWTFSGSRKVTDDLEEIPLYRKNNGNALFFAEGTVRWTFNSMYDKWIHENNPYSKYSYYFITEGESPAQWDKVETNKHTVATISNIPYYTVIDNDVFGWYEGGREMYDSHDFAYGNSKNYKLQATSLDEKNSRSNIDVSFTASSKTSSTRVAVAHNEKQLGTINVPKFSEFQSAYESRRSFINNNTKIENNIQLSVSPSNPSRLNYIRMNYTRKLVASDAAFSFTPNTSRTVQIELDNANKSHRLWCIGNGEHTAYEVATILEGNKLTGKVENGMDRFIVVNLDENYPTPEWDVKVENQNLHGDLNPYDMVIIIPESRKLAKEAERLAEAHRKAQGLSIKIVDAGQLFNEFSSGTPDASAYRRYMKMLYDRATTDKDLPRYLLLFGDCAWDNRMISDSWKNYSTKDFLLSFEVTDGFQHQANSQFALGEQNSYTTDDYFGWLDDNEGSSYASNKIDLSIGRFTCHTPEAAKVLVDKSINYLQNKEIGSWKNVIYVLADDGNGNLHMRDAEAVVKQIESSTGNKSVIKKVYNDAYTRVSTGTGHSFPTVTALLQEAIEQGALIFNYTGHGSPEQLSKSKILKTVDFEQSTVGNMPLWIMASCEISPYDSQKHDLGRAAIHNESGGAIAVMCASRTVYSNYNRSLNIAFNKHLFAFDKEGKRNTMGDALRLAKVEMIDPENNSGNKDASINKLKYALLGDPALPVTYPTGNVILDSINGNKLTAKDKIQLKAGSLVRFSGKITNRKSEVLSDYNGSITATISDRTENIICKNNDGSADNPMVYKDRTKKVYEGSDSVINGRFTIEFRIPKDISYTNDCARVTFYAVNKDKSLECNGANEQFYLNGTDTSFAPDTLSPKMYIFLNHPDFPNGGVTAKDPVFFAEIKDDAGINATGIGIGHNMELVIDDDYTNPIILNNKFTYKFGSYNEGFVAYQLMNLEKGKHTLSFKAWDVNGNSATSKLDFYIQEGVNSNFDVFASKNPAKTSTNLFTTFQPQEGESSSAFFEVYNVNGQKVWQSKTVNIPSGSGYGLVQWNLTNGAGARIPAGIYLYRVVLNTAGHKHESDAKKIIVLAQ